MSGASEAAKTPAVPVWHCEFKPMTAPLTSLTVGAKFEMDCKGDIAVGWKGQPAIELPEKTPEYSLVILAAPKLDANEAQLIVTSYRPGQAKPEFVRVMAGDVGFETADLAWDVQSVVKQQDPKQPPQPFGPYGPFSLSLPMWVWLALGIIVAAIAGGIWLWVSRAQRKRRLKDDLTNFSLPGMTASAQFHKELRQLSRKLISASGTKDANEWTSSLDRSLRVFLMREYEILTLKASSQQIFSRLKTKNRIVFDQFGEGLKKIFSEMQRFQSHSAQHKPVDFEQLLQMARRWCDDIEKHKVRRS